MDGFHLEVAYGMPHIKYWNALNVVNENERLLRRFWTLLDCASKGSMMLQNLARRERQRGMEGRGGGRGGEVWRTAGGGEVESESVSAFQVLNSDLIISVYVSHSLSRSLCIKVQCCTSSDLYRPGNNYKSVCRRMQPSLPLFSLFLPHFL